MFGSVSAWQGVEKFERETQTIGTVSRGEQTKREAGTQMVHQPSFPALYLTPRLTLPFLCSHGRTAVICTWTAARTA